MLRAMSELLPPERRRELAEKCQVDPAYLWQCLTGRRDMNPGRAREIEAMTRGELRRWHLCQKTWHQIWPELMRHKDAPPVHSGEAA